MHPSRRPFFVVPLVLQPTAFPLHDAVLIPPDSSGLGGLFQPMPILLNHVGCSPVFLASTFPKLAGLAPDKR